MSATRELVARLRKKLGEEEPLVAALPPEKLTPPPQRVFQAAKRESSFSREAAALVGIGHVGTRYSTDVVLQFQAELAVTLRVGMKHPLLPSDNYTDPGKCN